MFMNFKIDAADAAARLAQMTAAFTASGKPGTFEDNAVRVIGQRMVDHPEQHIEFGPYWWAVKDVLNAAGYDFGQRGSPMVAAEYVGASPAETLVMAEAFKDLYRASYIVGTSSFDLGGISEGETIDLGDDDMRERAGGVPAP